MILMNSANNDLNFCRNKWSSLRIFRKIAKIKRKMTFFCRNVPPKIKGKGIHLNIYIAEYRLLQTLKPYSTNNYSISISINCFKIHKSTPIFLFSFFKTRLRSSLFFPRKKIYIYIYIDNNVIYSTHQSKVR